MKTGHHKLAPAFPRAIFHHGMVPIHRLFRNHKDIVRGTTDGQLPSHVNLLRGKTGKRKAKK
jgi:hypothetical protein